MPLFGTKIRVAGFGGLRLGEQNGDRWYRVRKWVDENDPDNAWPRTIVYRNLRHHAAIKWFHEELGES